MSFAQPGWLVLLLAIPLEVLWRSRRPAQGVPLSTFRLLDARDARPRFWPRLLIGLRMLAIALLVIALARPQGEGRWITRERFGIDVMLALDLSGSMRAEDFQPANRLEAAKRVLTDFVAKNAEHRIGLVGFAGRSLTLCPLTTDTRAVAGVIARVGFSSVGQDGTAIGDGLGNCLYRLQDRSAKSRIIVLLSDGENNAGYLRPADAAAMARARGVRVYTIAIGKPGGAPIPLVDSFGRKVYVRNRDGSLFLPRMNEAALAAIATTTGGRYFRATDTRALEAAYAEIARLERSAIPADKTRVPSEQYPAWLLAGLLVLVLEFGLVGGLGSVLRGVPDA